jgi:hypothetical protein
MTLSCEIVKADKQYFCSYCSQSITTGTEYLKEVVEENDDIYTWRVCNNCAKVTAEYNLYDIFNYIGDVDGFEEALVSLCTDYHIDYADKETFEMVDALLEKL